MYWQYKTAVANHKCNFNKNYKYFYDIIMTISMKCENKIVTNIHFDFWNN